MKVVATAGSPESVKTEGIIIGMFENEKFDAATKSLDKKLGGAISRAIDHKQFEGKSGQSYTFDSFGTIPARMVTLAGLGKKKETNEESIRRAAASGVKALRSAGAKKVTAWIAHHPVTEGGDAIQAQATVEGAVLALYRFERLKSDKSKKQISSLTLLAPTAAIAKKFSVGAKRGQILADSACLARDLINEPGNTATPTYLANTAKKIAKEFGIKAKILGPSEIAKLKMGGLMAVSQGSKEPARFIILEWMKGPKSQKPVVLVGKGLTFDTGGISIKPSANMEEMKSDMSGGAAVLGAMRAAAALKMKINLVGIVPSTENMPGSAAIKPGDVATGLSGVTMEIINTDAEGRLILADALAYADRYKPDCTVDLATLTGACMVALGRHASGLFTNDTNLGAQIQEAGDETGERFWPLPLLPEHDDDIKSDVADIKNVGPRWGGASTAAAFLQHHVKGQWAHLDIAGTAYADKPGPYHGKGGVGIGVRTLISFLKTRAT